MIQYKPVDFDPFQGHDYLLNLPTTEAQQEIFASIVMDPSASCAFNESLTVDLQGPLNSAALKTAAQQTLIRHDALRATFAPDGSQFMISKQEQCLFKEVDMSNKAQDQQFSNVQQLREQEVQLPFDLLKGPLIRLTLVHLSKDHHLLLLSGHHIVCDGWSIAVLIEDLGHFYNAQLQGKTPELSPAHAFSDYAVYKQQQLQQKNYQKSEAYWLQLFLGGATQATPTQTTKPQFPILDLPTDYPRPTHRSYHSHRVDYELPLTLIDKITRLGAKQGCSLVNTLFAAFKLLIYSLTKESNLIIGMPAAEQSILGQYYLIGHCVNMLPIKTQLNPKQSFNAYLKTVKQNMLDAYEHQDYTFGSLIQKLPLQRDPSRIPLMPITFNLDQKIESKDFHWDELTVSYTSNPRRFENFELFVNASKGDGKLILEAQYNSDLFKEERVWNWMQQYESLLELLLQVPEQPITEVIASKQQHEQHSLLTTLNNTRVEYASQCGVHDLIHTQALQTPDKIALFDEVERENGAGQQMSYLELDQLSSQIAHRLIQHGVKSQDLVGLCMERSVHMVAALIGIWKSGAGYVPLDPNYPSDRLEYMIQNSGMGLIVTESAIAAELPDSQAKQIIFDQQIATLKTLNTQAPELVEFSSTQVAYTIYTSGSTGKPKGVMISHRNAVNFLQSMATRPGLCRDDKLLAVTTISFDIAVLELYLPLIMGAQVLIASRETAIDGEKLIGHIEQDGITYLQATPMTWRLMLACGWQGNPNLKMLCGGEPFPRDLVESLWGKVDSQWNMYGPTETTVWSTCFQIRDPQEPLYIGQPIANTQVYILDQNLKPVAPGETGALYIGGDGLAIGYLGAEQLTQEKFIASPIKSLPSSPHIYYTGDLGRYHHNGQLECLGRDDSQIKLRGFRIELGEIQTVIARHPAIAQCVIKLIEMDGDKSLCAYVILHPTPGNTLSFSDMRQFARQKLPEYMIPSHLQLMDDFPKTLNGKIDSKALPLPSSTSQRETETKQKLAAIDHPPMAASPEEQLLIQIFQQVLMIDAVTSQDNFFELGGHSLLSLKVIQQLKQQCSHQITPRMMLTDSIRQLGGQISEITDTKFKESFQSKLQATASNPQLEESETGTNNPEAEQAKGLFFNTLVKPNCDTQESPQANSQKLFGFYYPAVQQATPQTVSQPSSHQLGVMLLYPIQQEYMRCHWGIKHLAKRLAKQGFPVFKFDYYGSGDSFGESQDFNLQQCLADIQAAEQTFRQQCDIQQIAIIGMRLGATLAAQYARQHEIQQLYLWEPVINGQRHWQELKQLQKELLSRIRENSSIFSANPNRHAMHPGKQQEELLGYRVSQQLIDELQELDLMEILQPSEQRTLLVTSQDTREMRDLKEHLINSNPQFSYQLADDPINWVDLEQYLNSIIPHHSMNQIVSFLTGGHNE